MNFEIDSPRYIVGKFKMNTVGTAALTEFYSRLKKTTMMESPRSLFPISVLQSDKKFDGIACPLYV